MNLKSAIKNHKFFFFTSCCFIVWFGILAIISLIAVRTIIFYDARYQTDVSSQFSSTLPIGRYLLEPFYGIPFILETNMEYLIGFTLVFIVFRVIYLLLKRRGLVFPERFVLANYLLKDFLRSSFIIMGTMVLIVFIAIGIGYFVAGFFFINRYWNQILPIGIYASVILIITRTIYLIFSVFRPNYKFNYSKKKRYQPPLKNKNLIKNWRFVRKESVYLIGTMLLLVEAHIFLMYTRFPNHRIETNLEENEFLFDFHVHTIMSDGWLTPEARVQWYIEQGVSGAAFSDHDNIRGATIASEYAARNNLDFTVWIAEEWTDHEHDIHMNIFGLSEEIVPLESQVEGGPLALNASDMIKYVKNKGGYVTVNHYNDQENINGGIGVPYTYEQLRDWGVDGFEIVNGPTVQEDEIRQFCLKNNLICMGGSDTHTNEDITTLVKLKLENPQDKSLDNIFKNLRKNTHEVIAIQLYPNKVNFPNIADDIGGNVIQGFFEYIINLSVFQIFSWMGWSLISYLVVVMSYKRLLKVDLNHLREKFK